MQVKLLRAAFPLLLIVQFLASESSGQQASRGVPRDDAQAVASPRKVDDAYTQAALEMMKAADPNTKTYDMGRPCVVVGCPVTTEESQKIASMRKAADEGDPYAQTYIGVVYASGRGVPKNDAQAVGWYRKAADQGYGDAQTYLGIMYQTGRGVPRDDAQAAAWIRKAADQGDSYAQTTLGIMYETGRGVPKNNAQAVVWYRKAAAQNDELAKMKLVGVLSVTRSAPAGARRCSPSR